ncbi:hypothetical protein SARC_00260 [Sphaeroforma arctica JP610]|uniref:Uncharacterized protein n=1 Tax=Sphaeroforma arctica JP610 TaxID=667725 RepID=A0A0L0GFL0_9EUKA|nr:hypothetical protein SARC_00260 [Sphaeroforma arctica JP610]KNC87629.1 hypothetical protein SARC_00260 [Sphaeroforma arctica JP610]|eukprot:XP_014161531.1 hypothetical protein SARC_00260 [Sphaeroforma arctica JP610]
MPQFDESIINAVLCNETNPVIHLLENGFNVNETDDWGYSLLHYAASKGHQEMCLILLQRGADIRLVDQDSRTPRSAALENGENQIVDLIDTWIALKAQGAACLDIKSNARETNPSLPSTVVPAPKRAAKEPRQDHDADLAMDEAGGEPISNSTSSNKRKSPSRQHFCYMCGTTMMPNVLQAFCHSCGVKVNV